MSNLPLQTAVVHNDDNDDQANPTTNKFSTINSRITSPLIIKRQQNIETEIANNQAYDEIHDLQPKHSSIKKTNTDQSTQYYPSKLHSPQELMQGNYYDQTRYDVNSSATNYLSEPVLIDINLEDYKKTIAPVSTSKNNSNKARPSSPPFGNTSESIQQGIAQSAGILLELNKKQRHHHHHHKSSMKNNNKSHERAVLNYFPANDTDDKNKQRSLSASSSSSSSSSSDCSTSDSSTSNKCHEVNDQTNIPYEKLLNDEDDDEGLTEQAKKPITESTILLNKNLSQTYGTQTTNERGKYLPNNGYNSHGSSITTKSSSDNSGSIRTNSGSDNDEESDEEHYNNSTLSNHPHATSSKSINKPNESRYSYSNEQNSYQSGRSNAIRSEQIGNNDEHHLQVPRFKQLPHGDSNGNTISTNSGTDHTVLPYTSKWSLQQSSNNPTNTLSSSSHQNQNLIERQEQQQQQQQHSNSSRNSSRQHQIRPTKKRKQSQQQDIIRTELIPGHRGDRDVDELVMFIDGNSTKQRQNSASIHSTDTHRAKFNSLNDSNSDKTTSRKKSRKSIKILQQLISSTTNNENNTSNYLTPVEQIIQSNNFTDNDNQTTHPIVDITNQSSGHRNLSPSPTTNAEYPSSTINMHSTNTTNGVSSIPDWFEQTRHSSSPNKDDVDLYCLSPTITNNSNSEVISEPFVTVTHRRRLTKERRQDNNSSSRFPPPPPSSSSNINDKRRISSLAQNGIQRPPPRYNLSNNKPIHSTTTTTTTIEEHNHHRTSSESVPLQSSSQTEPSSSSPTINLTNNDQSFEKRQSSPRLSSHSSSSSLSSLIKRQSKPPPVVFLNKSIDIELNDVSFGFDLDSATLNKSSDEINNHSATHEVDLEPTDISTHPSLSDQIQSTDATTDKSTRRFLPRNPRGPQFYSGSDIRLHQHRNYPSQPMSSQSSYIDPLVLLQYNQQRLANYSQQLAYMNMLRAQYVPPQSQYVYLPTTYATTTTNTTNENDGDEDTNQTSSEPISEPVFVYATPTGQIYFQSTTTKKPYVDSEQQQPQQQSTPIPPVYTAPSTVYPSHYFYPSRTQHVIPSHPAYFQPISSASLLIESKSEQNDTDDVDVNHDDYEKSTKVYPQTRQQSSSDIMSNALQLVYSQQKRNAQTDRFNLDDLTAYLAMKWTDTVDHYEQGDNRIILVDEQ